MKTHSMDALAIAKALEHSPHVEEVIYPRLASHTWNNRAYMSLSPHAWKFVDSSSDNTDMGFPYSRMILFMIKEHDGTEGMAAGRMGATTWPSSVSRRLQRKRESSYHQ
jgi:hypothetical protein